MGINGNVFGSNAERENFRKLSRTWGDRYRIYHNIPFLHVFNTKDLHRISFPPLKVEEVTLDSRDLQRLKKTSVDYTLCDEDDRPLVCIDFDGMNQGFNVGTTYVPNVPPRGPGDDWRRTITELKLLVGHGSLFPYFVLTYPEFRDLTPNVRLTIVDGIIGKVMAGKAVSATFAEGFQPEHIGMTEEEFDCLSSFERDDLVRDWALGVEVESGMEHNPITRHCWTKMGEVEFKGWEAEMLTDPPIPDGATESERTRLLAEAKRYGMRVTISPGTDDEDSCTVWMPNFNVPGLGFPHDLLEEIGLIILMDHLSRA